MSTELRERVEQIIDENQLPDRHSYFQIEKFIIGREPTGHAQLWAVVRELDARKETVETFEKELKDAEDNLELFDIKIERLNRLIREEANNKGQHSDLNIQEHEINIRKLEREKASLVKSARKVAKKMRSTLEEMAHLVQGYDQIVEKIGPPKAFDDEAAQKEMWNEKLLEELNLRIILQRPLDPEFIKTAMRLSDDSIVKKQVVAILEQLQQKLISGRRQENIIGIGTPQTDKPKLKK